MSRQATLFGLPACQGFWLRGGLAGRANPEVVIYPAHKMSVYSCTTRFNCLTRPFPHASLPLRLCVQSDNARFLWMQKELIVQIYCKQAAGLYLSSVALMYARIRGRGVSGIKRPTTGLHRQNPMGTQAVKKNEAPLTRNVAVHPPMRTIVWEFTLSSLSPCRLPTLLTLFGETAS